VSGALLNPPALLLVSGAMLALALWLHRHIVRGLLGLPPAAHVEAI
jgi:hypothetical protein